jgi:Flp pilus assembly protein protease CpaA
MQMLLLLISLAITGLLIFGSYRDWKTRHVSNWITGAIIIISLPIIYFNLVTNEFNLWHYAGLIAFSFMFGGADVKVLIPIFLSLDPPGLITFLLIFCIVGFAYILITKKKNDVPVFLPITVGYVAVMLVV